MQIKGWVLVMKVVVDVEVVVVPTLLEVMRSVVTVGRGVLIHGEEMKVKLKLVLSVIGGRRWRVCWQPEAGSQTQLNLHKH